MLLLFDFKVTFYSAKVLTLLNTANKMSNNDKVLSCLIKINKGNLGQNKDNLMNLLMKDCRCSKKYFIGFNRKRGSSQYIKNEYYRIAYKVEINVINLQLYLKMTQSYVFSCGFYKTSQNKSW